MKLYRIHYYDQDTGNRYVWCRNKEQVTKEITEIKQIYKNENVSSTALDLDVDVVNFPTKKQELLEWLNYHLSTDNG